jgi:hypothetical protein
MFMVGRLQKKFHGIPPAFDPGDFNPAKNFQAIVEPR